MRKVGIVGFGRIGRIHCNSIKRLKDVEVIAVADSLADKLTEVFDEYGIDTYSNDFNAVIDNPEIDTVFIQNPETRDREISLGLGAHAVMGVAPAYISAISQATGFQINRIPVYPEFLYKQKEEA